MNNYFIDVIYMAKQITKPKPWTKVHIKNYKWLFNYIKKTDPTADENKFIEKDRRGLMTMIENNTDWKDGSKESLLFMIARYLHNRGDNRYSKLYSAKGHEYTLKIRGKEDDNKLDGREVENFRTHDFFENIINNINPDDIKTIEQHYKFLLLNMLVYQPPLRTSFYTTAKFIRLKKDNDHSNNYIWINKRGSLKVSYIVNQDKATNYKLYNMNKNLSTIPIDDHKLATVISDSFDKYPRTYLFELKTKPITSTTLLKYLKTITNVDGINIDMMRSSYITWFYDRSKTMGQKTKLAHAMRHSVDTAQRNYLKVFDVDINDIKQNNESLLGRIQELESQINEYKTKLNAYASIDEAPINDKLFKKRRAGIIYRLNKGANPRETSLNKYNIKLNNNVYS